MIPAHITRTDIAEATQRIIRDGVPPRRRGRGYCLVTNGDHVPPKYTIAVAHQVATGEWLRPDRFSGGRESNEFLRRRGFEVAECDCGGNVHSDCVTRVPDPSAKRKRTTASRRHSESCSACKVRVAEFLERIYGTCVRDHGFGWPAGLDAYAATSIGSVLRDVARILESHRGYGIDKFVRRDVLAPCDYWVPNPGFIIEFDERQHFTSPRKLALSVYTEMVPLGFSAARWIGTLRTTRRTGQPPSLPRRTTSLVRRTAGPRPVDQGLAADGAAVCPRSGLVLARSGQQGGPGTLLGADAGKASSARSGASERPLSRCPTPIKAARGDGISQVSAEVVKRGSAQRSRGTTAGRAYGRFIRRRGR